MRRLSLICAVAATATATAAPAKPTVADQIALARALAAKLDKGVPLGELADPVEGVHVWWVPGSEEIEQTRLHAGDKPAELFAKTEMTPYVQQHYASDAAAEIRYALAHLDVAPSTRMRPPTRSTALATTCGPRGRRSRTSRSSATVG